MPWCMILSMANVLLWWSTFIIFRLSAWPLSGSVDEADTPPVCLCQDWHSQHLPIILFYRCISTPYIFAFSGFSSMSNIDIHLKDPILKVLSGINVSNIIGGVPKRSGTLRRIFLRELPSFSFLLILLVVSSIVARLLFSSSLVWQVSLGSSLSQNIP